MKKYLFLFASLSLLFSCTGDEDKPELIIDRLSIWLLYERDNALYMSGSEENAETPIFLPEKGLYLMHYSWLTAGQTALFCLEDSNKEITGLYSIDVHTKATKKLSSKDVSYFIPTADGKRLVYITESDQNIFISDMDGGNEQKLTNYTIAHKVDEFTFGADSLIIYNLVALTGDKATERSELYSMKKDGSSQKLIVADPEVLYNYQPRAGHDSIIYKNDDGLFVAAKDGTNPKPIIPHLLQGKEYNGVEWYPAGLVFTLYEDKDDDYGTMYTIGTNGKGLTKYPLKGRDFKVAMTY